jgi:hypothetical protein
MEHVQTADEILLSIRFVAIHVYKFETTRGDCYDEMSDGTSGVRILNLWVFEVTILID